jgi:D-alanine transaminase
MPDIGLLNGDFMPLDRLKVPVEDRGYQFGDGVYEVIRTYHGAPFQVEAHLARLDRSARAIELVSPHRLEQWRQWIEEGIRRAGYGESKVYLQLTRGVAPRDHAFPSQVRPTAVLTVRQMTELDPALRTTGVEVTVLEDLRWARCDIKSLNLLGNVMARQRAKTAGAFEAIFVRHGEVTEGAVSNVMIVRDGVLITPPEDHRILAGVTRRLVLDLARKHEIEAREEVVTAEDFHRADEIFLTGTTVEVLAVVRIDGKPVKTGRPGPVTSQLFNWFADEYLRPTG